MQFCDQKNSRKFKRKALLMENIKWLSEKCIVKLWAEDKYFNRELVIRNLWTRVSIHQLIHHLSKIRFASNGDEVISNVSS
jgi:hypothetical protein